MSKALPPNVKLVTLTNNYASIHAGKLLLRLSHLYQAGEHSTLAAPVTFDLQQVFSQAGLKLTGAVETTLSANQLKEDVEKKKHVWQTRAAPKKAAADTVAPFENRVPFAFPQLTIRPMEVRTFLADFE